MLCLGCKSPVAGKEHQFISGDRFGVWGWLFLVLSGCPANFEMQLKPKAGLAPGTCSSASRSMGTAQCPGPVPTAECVQGVSVGWTTLLKLSISLLVGAQPCFPTSSLSFPWQDPAGPATASNPILYTQTWVLD